MQDKQLLRRLLSGLVFSIVVSGASAGPEMSVPDGWYLELNGGSSNISGLNYSGSLSHSGIGGNLNLGYKFMTFVAAEIGYTQYAGTDAKTSTGVKAATMTHYSYDLAIRGILPFGTTGFEGIAKLGASRMNTHVTVKNTAAANSIGIGGGGHSSTGLYIGAGVQYYFTPEFAGVLQWQRANGDDASGTGDLYSLGLSFIVN